MIALIQHPFKNRQLTQNTIKVTGKYRKKFQNQVRKNMET